MAGPAGHRQKTFVRALAVSLGGRLRDFRSADDADLVGLADLARSADIVAVQDIHIAPPRIVSSALAAMDDRHITVDGLAWAKPFLVVATQRTTPGRNHALPADDLDRFAVCLPFTCPNGIEFLRTGVRRGWAALRPVAAVDLLTRHIAEVRSVFIHDALYRYVADLATLTRRHEDVALGLSPRGAVALLRVAQALALCDGRDHVIPHDVRRLVEPVVAHRLVLTPAARRGGRSPGDVVAEVLADVPAPAAQLLPSLE